MRLETNILTFIEECFGPAHSYIPELCNGSRHSYTTPHHSISTGAIKVYNLFETGVGDVFVNLVLKTSNGIARTSFAVLKILF